MQTSGGSVPCRMILGTAGTEAALTSNVGRDETACVGAAVWSFSCIPLHMYVRSFEVLVVLGVWANGTTTQDVLADWSRGVTLRLAAESL